MFFIFFFFSSRRRHTRLQGDWSSDVCSSDLVAPGGGHRELWSDHEGHNVARWLSDHGIAAFVLAYSLAKETNSTYTVDDHALADMQRALRLVRSRAAEWRIATNRIGVMGFSAG